jgi:hypothetical protein
MIQINASLSFQFHTSSLKNNVTLKGHDMQSILHVHYKNFSCYAYYEFPPNYE